MGRRVEFHPLARTDLINLYRYIEEQSGPERDGGYLDRIERLCLSLADMPTRTIPRDDLAAGLRTVALERRVLVALSVNVIFIDVKRVPREERRRILEQCARGCTATVSGKVERVMMQPGLMAERVLVP